MAFITSLYNLLLSAAPWLLFGLVLAGVIKALLPQEWVAKQLGGHGPLAVTKAALLGAPLPLCSCSVVPVAFGLKRQGASNGATVSFLVSTPETGVDSIALSYALLGPLLAIIRPIAAVISALTAGLLCGTQRQPANAPVAPQSCSGGCCGGHKVKPAAAPLGQRIIAGVGYALTQLYGDLRLWLAIGLIAAALVDAYVPADLLATWGQGWTGMLLMLAVGLPMYICATASTPLAASLLMAGVSPGAVLVFLLAGPATNIGTLALVGKELGRRAQLAYLAGVCGGALLFGAATNQFVGAFDPSWTQPLHHHGELLPLWLSLPSLVLLLVLAAPPASSLLKRVRSGATA